MRYPRRLDVRDCEATADAAGACEATDDADGAVETSVVTPPLVQAEAAAVTIRRTAAVQPCVRKGPPPSGQDTSLLQVTSSRRAMATSRRNAAVGAFAVGQPSSALAANDVKTCASSRAS